MFLLKPSRWRNRFLTEPANINATAGNGVRREKAALFQWVQVPPGDSLPPEAIGAVMEVTKWLKPSNSGHELVTARVCRPQRE